MFITLDENANDLDQAIKKHQLTYGKHIFATTELIEKYGAQAIPKFYLINPEGEIIYSNYSAADDDQLTEH